MSFIAWQVDPARVPPNGSTTPASPKRSPGQRAYWRQSLRCAVLIDADASTVPSVWSTSGRQRSYSSRLIPDHVPVANRPLRDDATDASRGSPVSNGALGCHQWTFEQLY